jgi:hypothetical protein
MAFKLKQLLPSSLKHLVENYQERRRNKRLLVEYLKESTDSNLAFQTHALQQSHPNPLNKFGAKTFSQTDEDGITIEILRRINAIDNGTFAEFGAGNGLENNTLILKALGWRGFWVDGREMAFTPTQAKDKFSFFQQWVTAENVIEIAKQGIANLGVCSLDVISLDFDGNDIYLVEKLLANGFTPKLFMVEYNAKFIPPIQWSIEYDPAHVWMGDDYFGASLESFNILFNKFNYRLVCCNSHTGANAFFVREEFAQYFDDIPEDIRIIYVPPRYILSKQYGHRPSIRTIAQLFK